MHNRCDAVGKLENKMHPVKWTGVMTVTNPLDLRLGEKNHLSSWLG